MFTRAFTRRWNRKTADGGDMLEGFDPGGTSVSDAVVALGVSSQQKTGSRQSLQPIATWRWV